MPRAFEAIREAYRARGLTGALTKVIFGVMRRLAGYERKEELYIAKDLTETRAVSFKQKLTIRPVQSTDRPLILAFHREHRVDDDQVRRIAWYLDHGYNGFLAFLSDAPIGYLWWVTNKWSSRENHPHLRTYGIALADDEVYAVDLYLAPSYRGGSNAIEFMAHALKSLHDQGYRRTVGLVGADNKPARWTYSMLGYKTTRTVVGHVVFSAIGLLNGHVFLAKRRMF
jgi:GNAT superfamily N-acetyltransferase